MSAHTPPGLQQSLAELQWPSAPPSGTQQTPAVQGIVWPEPLQHPPDTPSPTHADWIGAQQTSLPLASETQPALQHSALLVQLAPFAVQVEGGVQVKPSQERPGQQSASAVHA